MAELLLHGWHLEPSVLAGCIAMLLAYWLTHRGDLSGAPYFAAGVAAIAVALLSPLDHLADEYLFSAHMVQHMLLIFVAPPLILLAITARDVRAILSVGVFARAESVLGNPAVAWMLGTGTLFFWHVPYFYDAALANEWLHILEHLTFLATGAIFWWPIVARRNPARMSPPAALVYLGAACVANSVLGIVLTFARPGLYTAYLSPTDSHGWLDLIRTQWGITPALDQQIGGLLMWTGGAPVFLIAMVAVLARWYGEPEHDETACAPERAVASEGAAGR